MSKNKIKVPLPGMTTGKQEQQKKKKASRFDNDSSEDEIDDDLQVPHGSRSERKSYIFLLGLTGGGKSSTLNKLFDQGNQQQRQETNNSFVSATQTILEYVIQVPVEGRKGAVKEMIVVDTPGFGDTPGTEAFQRDSQMMATLDNFLEENRELSKCYPTAVLLVVKFDDDRIQAETSRFVQMLKGINAIIATGKLIDCGRQSCNLVVVLTHTMSEQNRHLRKDPTPKIRLIESLVKTFTRIPQVEFVVMAENCPQLYNLPLKNGYCKLPNGDYYPYNLFQTLQRLTTRCKDETGEEIIRGAFKSAETLRSYLKKDIQLLPQQEKLVRKFYNQLVSSRFNFQQSEIVDEIQVRWNSLGEQQTKPFANSIFVALSVFQKLGIQSLDQIPQTKMEVVNLLSELPLNPALEIIVREIGITPPSFENDRTLGIGRFYNILNDQKTNVTPLYLQQQRITDIGFAMPACVTAKPYKETLIIAESFKKQEEYQKVRLSNLGIVREFPAGTKLDSPVRPGYNVIGENVDSVTGILEYREYALTLKKTCELKPSFLKMFDQLPKRYHRRDKNEWNRFLLANGTHVVRSAYAGGFIEVVATRKNTNKTTPNDALGVITSILKSTGKVTQFGPSFKLADWSINLVFHGGDPNLARPSQPEQLLSAAGCRFLDSWIESLKIHPVLLLSQVQLETVIVQLSSSGRNVEALCEAISKSTGCANFLTGKPPKRSDVDKKYCIVM